MYPTPLRVSLRPSRQVLIYLVVSHLAAAAAVLLSSTYQPWALLLLPTLAWSALRLTLRHATLRAPDALVGLERDVDGTWWLHRRDGQVLARPLRRDSYLHPGLLVLNFGAPWPAGTSVVIARDSTDSVHFRRLRVCLRLMGDDEPNG